MYSKFLQTLKRIVLAPKVSVCVGGWQIFINLKGIVIRPIDNPHDLALNFVECCTPGSGGSRGLMVIIVGNGHGDTSSNPGPG